MDKKVVWQSYILISENQPKCTVLSQNYAWRLETCHIHPCSFTNVSSQFKLKKKKCFFEKSLSVRFFQTLFFSEIFCAQTTMSKCRNLEDRQTNKRTNEQTKERTNGQTQLLSFAKAKLKTHNNNTYTCVNT